MAVQRSLDRLRYEIHYPVLNRSACGLRRCPGTISKVATRSSQSAGNRFTTAVQSYKVAVTKFRRYATAPVKWFENDRARSAR